MAAEHHDHGRRWRIAALVALGLSLAGVLMAGAGTALVVTLPLDAPDAILALASHEWERLPVAARLAGAFPESRVLLTLPPAVSRRNCYDCSHRVDYLTARGVERDRISVVPITLSNTYGEALAIRDYLRRAGMRRLLIVTSTYHTRRTLATFGEVLTDSGMRLGVVPADEEIYARPSTWWTRPYDRWYVSYEWAGIVWYRLRYGVPLRPAPGVFSQEQHRDSGGLPNVGPRACRPAAGGDVAPWG